MKGKIPNGLSGVFLRNGPNPYFEPLGRKCNFAVLLIFLFVHVCVFAHTSSNAILSFQNVVVVVVVVVAVAVVALLQVTIGLMGMGWCMECA